MDFSGPRTILCVDDDPVTLGFMKDVLSRQGYSVVTADSGAAALEAVDELTPDAVLLDASMPEMDGFELCARLRERIEMLDVPLIFVTSLAHHGSRSKAFAAGASGYVQKPLEESTIVRRVKGLFLESRSPARTLEATDWSHRFGPEAFERFKSFLGTLSGHDSILRLHESGFCSGVRDLGIPEWTLAETLASFLSLPHLLDSKPAGVPAKLFPAGFCRKHHVVAFRDFHPMHLFLLANPFDEKVIGAIRNICGSQREPRLIVAPSQSIESILSSPTVPSPGAPEIHELEMPGPLRRLVSLIVEDARKLRASEIHFDPEEEEVEVRFRVDEHLRVHYRLRPAEVIEDLVRLIRSMADLDGPDRGHPREGRIPWGGDGFELRVSFLPAPRGEKAILRFVERERAVLSLSQLGFSERHFEMYREKLTAPEGLLLHAGPPASGKTMALYAALCELRSPSTKILTAEERIEYALPGIGQLAIQPESGFTCARAIRSLLAQDPDVLLVGEIRDPETAQAALEAASTGRKVCGALAAEDAGSALIRLSEWADGLVASTVTLVCAQRLMRRLCTACRTAYDPDPATRELAGGAGPFFRARGCDRCAGTGYQGRIGLHEILVPGKEVVSALARSDRSAERIRAAAIEGGMTPLWSDAMEKVRAGLGSFEDALSILPRR